MNRSILDHRTFPFVLLCALGVVAPACGGSSSNDEVSRASTDALALTGTVGPGGGTLAGQPGTAFEGVRLEVPAGALSADVQVRITAIVDETPLPELAERVGVQFRIEPDAVLSTPAHLTLPVHAGSVQRFGNEAGDVKVWVRAGDGWTLREQTASAAGSVTVDLPAFTTAAAGVKLATGFDACGAIAGCSRIAPSFVVESLGIPNIRPPSAFGFETDGQDLYFGYQDTNLGAHIGDYNLHAKIVVPSQGLPKVSPAVGFPFTTNLALSTTARSVWAALGFLGHVEFRFDAAPNVFPRQNLNDTALGVARTSNDSIVLLSTTGRLAKAAGRVTSFAPWPSRLHPTIAQTGGFVSDSASPTGYWAPFDLTTIDRFDAMNQSSFDARSLPNQADVGPAPSVASAPDGSLAVVDRTHNVLLAPGAATVLGRVGLTGIRDISFDAQGALWMTAQSATEVLVRDANGTVHAIGLAANQLPIGIRAVSDGAIVMTANREIVHIVRR